MNISLHIPATRKTIIWALAIAAAVAFAAVLIFDINSLLSDTQVIFPIRHFGEPKGIWVAFALPWISLALSLIIGFPYIIQSIKSKPKVDTGRSESRKYRLVWRHLLNFAKTPKTQLIKRLGSLIWSLYSIGWILYFIAFWVVADNDLYVHDTPLGILMYSAACSIDMFMMDINDNVMDNIANHDLLKVAITAISIIAILSTLLMVLGLIFSRIISRHHSLRLKPTPTDNSNLYIFFGTNEPSRLLAHDIKREDKQSLIIFVENPVADEADTGGLASLLNFFTHRKEVFAAVDQDEHEGLLIANEHIEDIPHNEADKDIWDKLGLLKLKQLLEDPLMKQANFFFLSDDRDNNVAATINLSKSLKNIKIELQADKKRNNQSDTPVGCGTTPAHLGTDSSDQPPEKASDDDGKKGRGVRIFCQARLDGISQTIEEFVPNCNIYVRVIDNSNLSVELLRMDFKNHPINFVEVDTKNALTTVKTAFHSLVVGFGETGRDTVKFLYEFGAFVSSDSDSVHTRRSEFECRVVDPESDRLSGKFKALRPAIFGPQRSANTGRVLFYPYDARSEAFYTEVLNKEYVEKLNYVVVAAGDEELNLTIALDILRYAVRHRSTLDRFKILVRVYSSDKVEYLRNIVNHYNESMLDAEGREIIALFGDNKSIYARSIVIDDEIREEAINYDIAYQKCSNENLSPESVIKNWEKKREATFSPEADKLRRITKYRRQIGQNISNVLHKETKMHLIRLILEERQRGLGVLATHNIVDHELRNLYKRIFDNGETAKKTGVQTDAEIIYPNLSDREMLMMTNLARLEHLRWNAAHEMLGYTGNPEVETDDSRMVHQTLVDWELLDYVSRKGNWAYDYKNYDYLVVETTIYLWYNRIK